MAHRFGGMTRQHPAQGHQSGQTHTYSQETRGGTVHSLTPRFARCTRISRALNKISGSSLVLSIEHGRIRRSVRMYAFSSADLRPTCMLRNPMERIMFSVALAGITAILLLRRRG